MSNDALIVSSVRDIANHVSEFVRNHDASELGKIGLEPNFIEHEKTACYYFRGHSNKNWKVVANVHRARRCNNCPFLAKENELDSHHCNNCNERKAIYFECSMLDHYKMRNNRSELKNMTAFDWICLMQHHGLPTRILDWTESILVAMYFAVRPEPNEKLDDGNDGCIYALNARRLNKLSSLSWSIDRACDTFPSPIGGPDSFDLIIRANLPFCGTINELIDKMSRQSEQYIISNTITEQNTLIDRLRNKDEELMKRLRMPYAVIPNRTHPRMAAQASVFTIEGGRMYGDDYKPMDDHIPIPISLKGIKDWECFVKTFMIPASEKKHILSELDLLGINESVLFPDLDHDAIYVKSKWVSKSET